MTTYLDDLIDEARFDSRTDAARSNLFDNSALIPKANRILEDCRKKMVEVESVLVYAEDSISLTSGYIAYPYSNDFGPPFKVWLDGEDWFLKETVEEDKLNYDVSNITAPPEKYFMSYGLPNGGTYNQTIMSFLPVPDDTYSTAYFLYWIPLTPLTTTTGSTGKIPDNWKGIWDHYITKSLEYAIRRRYGRDTSEVSAELVGIEAEAMQEVFGYGIRKHRANSDFFSIDGV